MFKKFIALFLTVVMAFEFVSPTFVSAMAYDGDDSSFAQKAEEISQDEAEDEAEELAKEAKEKNPLKWIKHPLNSHSNLTENLEIDEAILPDISALAPNTRNNNWYLSKEYDKLPYNEFHIRVQKHIRKNNNDQNPFFIQNTELYLEYDMDKINANPDLKKYKKQSSEGSADIWLEENDDIFIWEVKPYSYSIDMEKNAKGLKQLEKYVECPKKRAGDYIEGTIEKKEFNYGKDFREVIPNGEFCFKLDVNTPTGTEHVRYDVSYQVDNFTGMIYYSFTRVLEGKDPPRPPVKEKEAVTAFEVSKKNCAQRCCSQCRYAR